MESTNKRNRDLRRGRNFTKSKRNRGESECGEESVIFGRGENDRDVKIENLIDGLARFLWFFLTAVTTYKWIISLLKIFFTILARSSSGLSLTVTPSKTNGIK